jgi:uncharacterized membrane protein
MSDSERIPVGPVGVPVAANIIAALGAFVFAAVTAMDLPARYPSHFNAAGQPDRWSEAGGIGWYAMPIFAAALAAVMVALALLLPRIPMSLVNVPRKEQFLRLSTAERTPILQFLIRYLLWLSAADTLLFIAIHWMMYRSALDARVGGNWLVLAAATAVYSVLLVWGIVRTYRMVRQATARLGPDTPASRR